MITTMKPVERCHGMSARQMFGMHVADRGQSHRRFIASSARWALRPNAAIDVPYRDAPSGWGIAPPDRHGQDCFRGPCGRLSLAERRSMLRRPGA